MELLSLSLIQISSETTSMVTRPLDSALTGSAIDFEKAWHILTALLSLGCLVRPSELSSRCSSFLVLPQLVQHLCSVTNWPLSLSDGLHVMPLLLAVTALAGTAESVSRSGGANCSLRTYSINLWCCRVGQLVIVDHDVVELNNMHNQLGWTCGMIKTLYR